MNHNVVYRTEMLRYTVDVVPPRCRTYRTVRFEENVDVAYRVVDPDSFRLAFRVHETTWRAGGGEDPHCTDIFCEEGNPAALWRRDILQVCGEPDVPVTFAMFCNPPSYYLHDQPLGAFDMSVFRASRNSTRETAMEELRAAAVERIVVDGYMFTTAGEPRWVVQTFGLGHNHGGTALFTADSYNPNIAKSAYYRADQRAEAIAAAEDVASRRGDTRSVPIRPHGDIEVVLPEAVRLNPAREHGDGDPFLNALTASTSGTSSVGEAGFVALAVLAQHLGD